MGESRGVRSGEREGGRVGGRIKEGQFTIHMNISCFLIYGGGEALQVGC